MCDNIPDSVIKRAASGDSGAMNEIITFYQKLVYNIACSMLRDGNDALDASQEVFIRYTAISENSGSTAAFRHGSTVSQGTPSPTSAVRKQGAPRLLSLIHI